MWEVHLGAAEFKVTVRHLQVSDESEDGAATYVISLPGGVKGRLDEAHLSDHPAAVAALAECIAENTDPGQLMVLERMQVRCALSTALLPP